MQAQKPTASIIIPNKDEWKMTCRCLEAIRKFTRESCEVILVDNGSSKVPEVIRQYPFLRLIRNNWNRGFAAAINQGLERAKGEYLVWLNNDTLPSYRWLTQLLHVLRSDSSIGLVGPVSNRVIPEQKIAVSLRSVDKILRFSRQFNRTDPDRWRDTLRLSGFCLVYPREVLQKVGLLDERFGLGTYEDDDYCYRVRQAGYRLVVAGDTYVHHFGSTSFRKNGYDEFRKILAQNRRYYIDKWQRIPEGEG
ncbi:MULTISPECIES: glycosyltransferase family 2 protein [Thermoactinomyces]|jgi:GT2 family glycosyltransferase|uniref:Glycosyltransferase family 2 protein n=1 Tax=Thermoactinomyces daqus TaxID=1329516 RepID=A0A7W1XBU7_9BACL|nr:MULTISPECIES: glycosyltransferase family 2 protein [Thermoactinomyces]MBA4543770.1 glycosyltransferase family 2 protein [Thermoactinomyces daqus]MBH8598393.1 glycosyltransferase family 2 protein [Thermoactinomyces sp. CICC 10523]MBH8604518.1 glycosyltransferase family 2 protein [Thermoactinomyces sp. CICC 10522]MBH8607479.1 glycosyltransferase family 2 protein [Thermoactinomyces sp. CICC 10521]